jgi:hypothetical protein
MQMLCTGRSELVMPVVPKFTDEDIMKRMPANVTFSTIETPDMLECHVT